MADSNLTRRALASASKELMTEIPFEKISISNICEKCNMSRKSFYYHFKDKYDLVNWIFDIEFISVINSSIYTDRWELLESLSNYFYENRFFYRKALKIEGQNSFPNHFRECLRLVLQKRLEDLTPLETTNLFVVNVITDSCICAFERWLGEKNCMPPEQFVSIIKSMLESIALSLSEDMKIKTDF